MAGLLFYLVPVIVPQVRLIPGERQIWRYGFRVSAIIWITGAFLFALYYLAVSYTHLDVYKRQMWGLGLRQTLIF